jgi:ankyrin repeat protein
LGQTIEHIVCMTRDLSTPSLAFVESVRLRPDIKDFYGNLPLYYCLDRNDLPLTTHLFKRGKDYFNLKNYSFETIFHIAARRGALDSLKLLIDD